MNVNAEELKSAAWDARIKLTAEEEKELKEQTENIFRILEEINGTLSEISDAVFYGHDGENMVREDIVEESLPLESALANAPEADNSCFQVPRIIEE